MHENDEDVHRSEVDAQDRAQRYLADQDIACQRCGYNLRGLPTPLCPECRWVVEIPDWFEPSEETEAMRITRFLRQHYLRCRKCRTCLFRYPDATCPTCGMEYSLKDLWDLAMEGPPQWLSTLCAVFLMVTVTGTFVLVTIAALAAVGGITW